MNTTMIQERMYQLAAADRLRHHFKDYARASGQTYDAIKFALMLALAE